MFEREKKHSYVLLAAELLALVSISFLARRDRKSRTGIIPRPRVRELNLRTATTISNRYERELALALLSFSNNGGNNCFVLYYEPFLIKTEIGTTKPDFLLVSTVSGKKMIIEVNGEENNKHKGFRTSKKRKSKKKGRKPRPTSADRKARQRRIIEAAGLAYAYKQLKPSKIRRVVDLIAACGKDKNKQRQLESILFN